MAWVNGHFASAELAGTCQFSDQELCQKTRAGCARARNLLWQRHQDFVQRVIGKRNQQKHLPWDEMTDALQEAYFAFHEAVQRFDPSGHSNGKPASFKTFLGVIVARHFSNYCRHWQRYHKRMACPHPNDFAPALSISPEEAWPFWLEFAEGNNSASKNGETNLLRHFSSNRLTEALDRLKPKEMRLLEIWLQYGRDKEVARALAISTTAAKLRRERLFHRLKQNFFKNDTFFAAAVNNDNTDSSPSTARNL